MNVLKKEINKTYKCHKEPELNKNRNPTQTHMADQVAGVRGKREREGGTAGEGLENKPNTQE